MSRGTWTARPEVAPANITQIDPLLVRLLGLCTPHKHEHHIANIIINECEFTKPYKKMYAGGNVLITVGEKPTSMFSCHMDIVGNNTQKDTTKVDQIYLMEPVDEKRKGFLYGAKSLFNKETRKWDTWEPSTLGADDKVGVYILLKMIEKGIPGLYAFHVGEECGGIGSAKLAKENKPLFKDIQRAIAFDRADYGDVIYWQRGGICCSNEFGDAFAKQLNLYMPPAQQFKSGVHGMFTDTANYRELIPECTNISVGYFQQHGVTECMDYVWLKHILLPAVLKVEYEGLPTKRDPKAVTSYTYSYGSNFNSSHKSGAYTGGYVSINKNRKTWQTATVATPDLDLPEWNPKMGWIDEADEDVLIRAIEAWFMRTTQAWSDRKEAAKIFSMYVGYSKLIEDELHSCRDQIKKLTGKSSDNDNKEVTTDISIKKDLLGQLINVSHNITLDNMDSLFRGYAKGSEKFLKNHEHHHKVSQFNKKELRKFNKMIYMMAYYLSLNVIPENIKEIEKQVFDYVEAHRDEEGFELEPMLYKRGLPAIVK